MEILGRTPTDEDGDVDEAEVSRTGERPGGGARASDCSVKRLLKPCMRRWRMHVQVHHNDAFNVPSSALTSTRSLPEYGQHHLIVRVQTYLCSCHCTAPSMPSRPSTSHLSQSSLSFGSFLRTAIEPALVGPWDIDPGSRRQ